MDWFIELLFTQPGGELNCSAKICTCICTSSQKSSAGPFQLQGGRKEGGVLLIHFSKSSTLTLAIGLYSVILSLLEGILDDTKLSNDEIAPEGNW